jgi:hypothetical protein
MPKITFEATLTAIGSQTVLRVPKGASRKLPSRGMSMVEGTFNGRPFQAPLEPDGIGSHWFRVSDTLLKAARVKVGDSVSVAIEPMTLWPGRKCPWIWQERWRLIPRCAAYGWTSRLWRAGIGSAGSAQPETVTRARSGSRRRSRNFGRESARLAASTAVNALILRCRATACCSNQRSPLESPTAGRPDRKRRDAFEIGARNRRAAQPLQRR